MRCVGAGIVMQIISASDAHIKKKIEDCEHALEADALAYIQQLEAQQPQKEEENGAD